MSVVSGIALRPWLGQEGRVKKGARFGEGGDFPAIGHRRAKVLYESGLFLPDAEAAGKASPRPSGGKTGAIKQSSSSPAGHQPRRSRSKSAATGQE